MASLNDERAMEAAHLAPVISRGQIHISIGTTTDFNSVRLIHSVAQQDGRRIKFKLNRCLIKQMRGIRHCSATADTTAFLLFFVHRPGWLFKTILTATTFSY